MRIKYVLCLAGCCFIGLSVMAEVQPIHSQTTVNAFDTAIMSSPLMAKISYRSAWEADNQPEYSYFYHIDKAAADPTMDPALQKQLATMAPTAKSADYGLTGKAFGDDLNGLNFKQNATEILTNRSEKIQVNTSADELTKMQPTDAELEQLQKAARTAAETKPKYPGINLNDF